MNLPTLKPVLLSFALGLGVLCGNVASQGVELDRSAFAKKQLPDDDSRLTDRQIAEGWISLFDGESLYGWRNESDANWRVENGAITVDQGTEPGLLRTTTQFDDFELRLQFKPSRGVNSGVFCRTSPRPKSPAGDCYEINIVDDPKHAYQTGSLVAREKAKSIELTADRWHSMRIKFLEGKVEVAINGKVVCRHQDSRALGRGYIGLQFNRGQVSFRNLFLKPLRLDPLFDGSDLKQWTTYTEMAGKFSVTESGDLHVENGPGQLESKRELGDFWLQLDARTNAKELNSGIFFRCIPGQKMNGYEVQIHNGFADGDRNRPTNCGTGGIFRRSSARRVVSDDEKWFTLTLSAVGPHFSVWVDGQQVCDWTDQRKPDENPRRGQRLEAGTLMLQAHDPTTDLFFRAIRARELTARRPHGSR